MYLYLGVLYKLLQGKRISAATFSREFEVSTRTIYRIVENISAAGFNIISYSGKNGGFELEKAVKLNLNFTKEEFSILISALSDFSGTESAVCLREKLMYHLNEIDKKTI